MPLFYFDVYDGFSGPDRAGKDYPDRDVARHEAWRRAEKLLTEEADWFRTGQSWQICIFDAAGAPIFVLYFWALDGRQHYDPERRQLWCSISNDRPCAGFRGISRPTGDLSSLGRTRDNDR